MKKIKRIVTLVLVFIISISLLTGCGTKTEPPAPAASVTTGEQQPSTGEADQQTGTAPDSNKPVLPLTAEKVTLTLWHPFPPFFGPFMKSPDDGDFFPEMEKRTNVHIDIKTVSTETIMENFNLMVASGDYPDMLFGAASMYTGGPDKAVDDKFVLRLNELIDKYAPNFKKLRESNPQIAKDTMTDAGNIIQMSQVEISAQPSTYGPQVRKDWLDDLGIQVPVTYDDYYNMLKAFKDKKGATSPMLLSFVGVPSGNYLVAGYGVQGYLYQGFNAALPFYQVDGQIKFGPIEPGFKEYLTMMAKWYADGLIGSDFVSHKDSAKDPDENSIVNGKAGLWYDDQWKLSLWKTKAKDPNFHAVAIPDAVKAPGDKSHQIFVNEIVGNAGYNISTDCKNPELAVKWIDYWYSDEGSLLANYGLEGKAYSMVNGKPKFTELVTKNKDGMSMNLAISKFAQFMGPFVHDWTRYQGDYTQEELDAQRIWASTGDNAYQLTNFAFMTAEENEKFATKFGDIQTYVTEMIVKFIMGRESLTKWDEYTGKIKKMGIDECISYKQAALDRYKARK